MSRTEEAEYTTATTVARTEPIQTEVSIPSPRHRHPTSSLLGAQRDRHRRHSGNLLLRRIGPGRDSWSRFCWPSCWPRWLICLRGYACRVRLASGIAVLLLLALVGGIVNFSYNQATNLAEDLPKYTNKIQEQFSQFRKKAESLQVLNPQHEKGVLNVRPATDWGSLLTQGFGSMSYALLAASFVPFLVYFMLSWHHHVRSCHGDAIPHGAPPHSLRSSGDDLRYDSQLYGGKFIDRSFSGGYQHIDLLGCARAVFLFCWVRQRIFESGALFGSGAGDRVRRYLSAWSTSAPRICSPSRSQSLHCTWWRSTFSIPNFWETVCS